jgi:hypothetical protein
MTETGGQPPRPKRKPKDILRLRGERIITEDDLDRTFPEEDSVETGYGDRRRHIFHGTVLVFLVALLVAAVLAALAVMRGDLVIPGWEARQTAGGPRGCPTGTYDYPDNGSFTLNIYNGTRLEGLAGQAAEVFKERGYKIGKVESVDLIRPGVVAVVVAGPAGEAGAFNLQRNLKGTSYKPDARGDNSVDLLVGTGFKELVPEELVDQTPGSISCPLLTPQPAAGG